MARTIPHRELRNDSSRVLDEVRRGETIHITNHGEIVATLVPPSAAPPLTYRPAREPGSWADFELPPPAPGGLTSEELLDELRGDR